MISLSISQTRRHDDLSLRAGQFSARTFPAECLSALSAAHSNGMRTINVTKERREPGCNSNVSRRAHWHRAVEQSRMHVLHLRTCIKRPVLSSSLIARHESTIQRRIPLFLSISIYRALISGSAPRNRVGRRMGESFSEMTKFSKFEIIFLNFLPGLAFDQWYDYLCRNEKIV